MDSGSHNICRGGFSSDWEGVAKDWKTHTVGMAN